MTVYQLPAEVHAFARCLRELAGRLDPGAGWYGVFVSRDPEGLRACFDGTEIMPWDLVESLLQDLGEAPSGPTAARVGARYAAAAVAHDRRPGGAEALRERRELRERERRHAENRARELGALLDAAPDSPDAPRLRTDLAWARDERRRATARIAALTARLHRLTGTHDGTGAAEPGGGGTGIGAGAVGHGGGTGIGTGAAEPGGRAGPGVTAAEPGGGAGPGADAADHGGGPGPDARAATAKRRPRGARYAWMGAAEEAPQAVAVPQAVDVPPTPGDHAAAPRGARFAAAEAVPEPRPRPLLPAADLAAAERAAGNAVYALGRLRAQGRSGEAHALLCEALAGPPAWLPPLAAELHRAGLGADWTTLLWEAATLPPGRLAAVAGALADAGRDDDCDQLLRQGVSRPVEELAGACAALRAEEHHPEARALLTAFVRVRTPEDAARLAAVDPYTLVPQLLDAAGTLSPAHVRALSHALRVAGLAGA
ncbi:UL36 very large tegument protein [Streptomyces sp. NPDC054861]